MPVYLWVGNDSSNKKVKGEEEAPNEDAVRTKLIRQKIIPSKIKEKPKDLFENIAMFQPKITGEDIIVFARQFSTMIDAGLPIIQCLDILFTQQENPAFKKILKKIKEDVEGGQTLADALGRFPDLFDNLFVNMIAAGEAGGILDVILQRLAAYLEKAAKLKAQVKSAMMYPMITIVIAVIVVCVILVFVIPVFQDMFAGLGKNLPIPTQIVVNLSNFVKGNIVYMLGGLGLFIFAYKRFYSTPKGEELMDDLFLKLPVFGNLLRKVAVSKFTRTMSTMMSSGVSILESLDIVAKTAGNKTIEKAIYGVRAGISEGRTMSDPLLETGVFPNMVCSMIAVGESTGALDTMLGKIADFYDDEVDSAVEGLTAAIEPMMMVFLGVVIGGLVVSMYLPIFKMAGAIG
ncbi:MAG: type II secretion system F family protein [Desulfobacterales bacterium]|jgi:type IV pilus assembly protein PilC|nr:type II secretion system F family protein [Desulfobacteraceae bacterium]MBT4364395.1 type II secretion system F family protein [Desulfobacteraceae bacterium]MBT7085709.1 type II secretion system F family protein [Desulfobacterales bacterium]MBT7696244.1 type II secretion system F family protein [Desulfobacterales bacterium]